MHRRRGIGVDAYLTKPVKHSDLLDALATLFGVSTRQRHGAERAVQPAAQAARSGCACSSRKTISSTASWSRTLLQKRGHHVTAVENGRAAVDAIDVGARTQFDVVLMDVQMPEMGGLRSDAAPSASAKRGSGGHLPIIALTAHAMQGDRERCLAAGMDGYLSKPIDVDDLIATVERFGTGAAAVAAAPARRSSLSTPRLRRAGGSRYTPAAIASLLKQVIGLFRADYAGVAAPHRSGAPHGATARRLRLAAHALKGAIATVGLTGRPGRGRRARTDGASRTDSRPPSVSVATCVQLDQAARRAHSPRPTSCRARRGASAQAQALDAHAKTEAIMKKILVVDDDQATRHVLQKVLTERRLLRRPSRRTALRRSRRSRPAVRPVAARRLDAAHERARAAGQAARAQDKPARRRDDVRRCAADAARGGARTRVQVRAQTGRGAALLQTVREVLAAPEPPPIEVISARPEWVELVVPCTREAADRIEAVMAHLEADLRSPTLRESIGYAFRELLLNAIEWGGTARSDAKGPHRVSATRRAC